MLTAIVGKLTSNEKAAINPVGAYYRTWDDTYGQRVFKYVKNDAGAALTASGAVAMDYAEADKDAAAFVKKPATGTLNLFGGLAMAALTDVYYGWVQVFGYTASIVVKAAATNTLLAGCSLKCVNGQVYMSEDQAVGTEATYARHAVSLEAYTVTDATSTVKGLIFAGLW